MCFNARSHYIYLTVIPSSIKKFSLIPSLKISTIHQKQYKLTQIFTFFQIFQFHRSHFLESHDLEPSGTNPYFFSVSPVHREDVEDFEIGLDGK